MGTLASRDTDWQKPDTIACTDIRIKSALLVDGRLRDVLT